MQSVHHTSFFERHLRGAIALLVLSAMAVGYYLVIDLHPDPQRSVLDEDGLYENLQAALFALAAIGFSLVAARSRFLRERNNVLVYWAIAGWALLMVLFFGEEISWGQRVFNWETPTEGYFAENLQGETNIHSQPFFSRYKIDFINYFILTFGVALPLLSIMPQVRTLIRFLAFPVAPWQYAIPFAATYAMHAYLIFPQEAYGYAPREYSETLLAACLVLFAWHGVFRKETLFRASVLD